MAQALRMSGASGGGGGTWVRRARSTHSDLISPSPPEVWNASSGVAGYS
ncbi:MAG: hypothetical protein H7840_17960 [Alphaproteobacteria bacterium]